MVVVASSSTEGGRLNGCGRSLDPTPSPDGEFREAQMHVATEPSLRSWSVLALFMQACIVPLSKASLLQPSYITRSALGEILDLGLKSDDGGAFGVDLHHDGIIFRADARWCWQEVERCASIASTTMSLCSMRNGVSMKDVR
jgi:hypothetical protein